MDPHKRTGLGRPPSEDDEEDMGVSQQVAIGKNKPVVPPSASMGPPPDDTEIDRKELDIIQVREAATVATLSSAARQSMCPDIVEMGFRVPDTLTGETGFEASSHAAPVAFADQRTAVSELLASKDNPMAGVFAPTVEEKPSRAELRRRLRSNRRAAADARRSGAARATLNQRAATKLQKAASSKNEAEAKAAKQQIILRNTVVDVLTKAAHGAKNSVSKKKLLVAADNVYGRGMKEGLSMSALAPPVVQSVLMKAGMTLAASNPDLAKELTGFGPDDAGS